MTRPENFEKREVVNVSLQITVTLFIVNQATTLLIQKPIEESKSRKRKNLRARVRTDFAAKKESANK